METSNPKLKGREGCSPPPFVMWMDGVEFGHVGIYSIIDEFIYPIPVGTHTKQWMTRVRGRHTATPRRNIHSLAPMSTIVQPRCGVKVRARLLFFDDDDGDGRMDTERER